MHLLASPDWYKEAKENMTGIIIAAAVVGITGIVIGILLGIAGDKFKVEVDQKEIDVRAE